MYRDEIDDILAQYCERLLHLAVRVVVYVVLVVAAMWAGSHLKALVAKPLKNVEKVLDTVSKSSTRVAISIADTAIKGWQSSQD
ncbi:MAG: hypothetical protein ACKOTB_12645 [Planctomycetia bacterium]